MALHQRDGARFVMEHHVSTNYGQVKEGLLTARRNRKCLEKQYCLDYLRHRPAEESQTFQPSLLATLTVDGHACYRSPGCDAASRF